MIPQKQLSLPDIFEDCKEIYESDKPQFLTLLENHINLDEIIPTSFCKHYYASTGRNRKYPLNTMLIANNHGVLYLLNYLYAAPSVDEAYILT